MIIVTEGVPSYFRDTQVLHSANGTGEGFTALDRFRIWGRPLEKRKGIVDVSSFDLNDKPLFVNEIFDDPTFFGSSDITLTSSNQSTLTVTTSGQTGFTLPNQPADPAGVLVFLRGVKLVYGVDYTVGGVSNQDLTIVGNISNPLPEIGDTLEVWYIQY
jgi:hypothetical protein